MIIVTPKNCDVSVKKAIQLLSSKLDYSAEPIFGALTLSKTCTLAAGANILRVTGLQTDNIAMTGTLRGAYIDVSNGSLAATGTIRAMELKARTEAPGDTGNDVAVLEGLSISADSKAHSVTTMRAAEFILDGKTAGTIDEAVGLRIANNLQIDKATVSYGLQIYRDSFDYTADIQLSNGAMIGTLTSSGLHLKLDADTNYLHIGYLKMGGERRILADGPGADNGLTLNAEGTDGIYFNYVDGGSGGVHFYDGAENRLIRFMGDLGYGSIRLYDQDDAEYLDIKCCTQAGFIDTKGVAPGILYLQNDAQNHVYMFQGATSGEVKSLKVYGYKAGDSKRALSITTGGTANDTVDFTGVSNYKFGGAGEFTGLTITGNSVFGLNSSVFQPTTDSTTFFQVLDVDGGVPILNVDSINERVGIGTAAPNAPLEVKGVKPGIVGGFQSGQLQVTGSVIDEFYNAVITGHNSFNGNTQLWYLGNTSSLNNDIAFINRQNAPIHFYTNNTSRMTIDAAGTITGLSTAAFEGASVTIGKASTTTGTLILHDSNSANTITLTVPDISAGSLSFTLPPTDGDNLDVLQTNGSGVLTWVAPGGGGAFTSRCSVYRNATQAVSTGTWTKILLNTEDYDINGEFDNSSNYRFQPNANGYYSVKVAANIASLAGGKLFHVAIYKNGVKWKTTGQMTAGTATIQDSISCDMYLITTDYIELWLYHTHGDNRNVADAVTRLTFMDVHRFA